MADAVRFIMKQKGFDVFAYVDDFMIVSPKHKAHLAFRTLYDLLTELGLPINPDKCNPPQRSLYILVLKLILMLILSVSQSPKLILFLTNACPFMVKNALAIILFNLF